MRELLETLKELDAVVKRRGFAEDRVVQSARNPMDKREKQEAKT
jgi:hypothetical protein